MWCVPGFEFIKKYLSVSELNYLEIGVFDGVSVATLASLYPKKVIYAIDPFIEDGHTRHATGVESGNTLPVQKETTFKNISGLKNIIFHEMTSAHFLQNVLSDDLVRLANVGAVLIDGSHWYHDVIVDIEIALKLIGGKKGVVVFDDVYEKEIKLAYNEFLENQKEKITKIEPLYSHEDGALAIVAVHLN